MDKIYVKLWKDSEVTVYGKYTIAELNRLQDAGWLWKRVW